ncbi:MAG: EamA family transporter [Pseudomonadales bacterium]|nr:EamA family transporter [Pseudomonadales bacterium]
METWVFFTILAVIMQSVRTAGQKKIAQSLSAQATTLVRFLYGLPFAWLYVIAVFYFSKTDVPTLHSTFALWTICAAIAQIIATLFLVKALSIKNFAVGSALAKTEALMAAIIGACFFSENLTFIGYASVFIGMVGALVASDWKINLSDLTENKSIRYGLIAGLAFGLTSVWVREASLSLDSLPLSSAAITLAIVVSLQTIICCAWTIVVEPKQFQLMAKKSSACFFIGITSIVGSVGWFSAMSLQNVAVVKTLGQIEFVLIFMISHFYFSEKITAKETFGIALIAVSVLLLLIFYN